MLKSSLSSCLAICAGLIAATAAHADSTYQQALSAGSVRVAVYNQAPWGLKDANGEFNGFSVDVLRTALSRMGVKKFEAVSTEFGALIPALQAHRVDVVTAGLFITPERCRLVAFGDPDIKMADALLVKAGNPKNLHSYEDVAKIPAQQLEPLGASPRRRTHWRQACQATGRSCFLTIRPRFRHSLPVASMRSRPPPRPSPLCTTTSKIRALNVPHLSRANGTPRAIHASTTQLSPSARKMPTSATLMTSN